MAFFNAQRRALSAVFLLSATATADSAPMTASDIYRYLHAPAIAETEVQEKFDAITAQVDGPETAGHAELIESFLDTHSGTPQGKRNSALLRTLQNSGHLKICFSVITTLTGSIAGADDLNNGCNPSFAAYVAMRHSFDDAMTDALTELYSQQYSRTLSIGFNHGFLQNAGRPAFCDTDPLMAQMLPCRINRNQLSTADAMLAIANETAHIVQITQGLSQHREYMLRQGNSRDSHYIHLLQEMASDMRMLVYAREYRRTHNVPLQIGDSFGTRTTLAIRTVSDLSLSDEDAFRGAFDILWEADRDNVRASGYVSRISAAAPNRYRRLIEDFSPLSEAQIIRAINQSADFPGFTVFAQDRAQQLLPVLSAEEGSRSGLQAMRM